MARQNFSHLFIGRPGTGKTTLLKKLIEADAKKVLIYDIDDNPAWAHLKNISIDLLPRWTKGSYRIVDTDTDRFLDQVMSSLANCTIVFEDASKYFQHAMPDQLKRLVLARKQRNIDLFFCFHSARQVRPQLFTACNSCTLFKTGDNIKEVQEKIPNLQAYHTAWKEVESSGFNYENRTFRLY